MQSKLLGSYAGLLPDHWHPNPVVGCSAAWCVCGNRPDESYYKTNSAQERKKSESGSERDSQITPVYLTYEAGITHLER